jgi:hypothetical protein
MEFKEHKPAKAVTGQYIDRKMQPQINPAISED